MSFWAVNWAFNSVRGLSPAEKLVLIYLAQIAGEDDRAWPSRESIAEYCEISLASVRRALSKLEKMDLVRREARYVFNENDVVPHRVPSAYQLVLPAEVTRRKSPVQPMKVKMTLMSDQDKYSNEEDIDREDEAEEQNRRSAHEGQNDPHVEESHHEGHGDPHVPYIRQDQLIPPLPPVETEPAPVGDEKGGEESSSVIAEAATPPPPDGQDQEDLLTSCVPSAYLSRLTDKGRAEVYEACRTLVDEGALPSKIYSLLNNNPLPEDVKSYCGLLIYRLREADSSTLKPSPRPRYTVCYGVEEPAEPKRAPWMIARDEAMKRKSKDADRPIIWWVLNYS